MSEPDLPIVLTSRLSAVGWHLAGARVQVVGPGEAAEAFAVARASTGLLLLFAEVAKALPPAQLAAARRASTPLLLVVDEALDAGASRPAARYVRAVLGVGS